MQQNNEKEAKPEFQASRTDEELLKKSPSENEMIDELDALLVQGNYLAGFSVSEKCLGADLYGPILGENPLRRTMSESNLAGLVPDDLYKKDEKSSILPGIKWQGFQENFPGRQDSPKFKRSGLLDLDSDLHVLNNFNPLARQESYYDRQLDQQIMPEHLEDEQSEDDPAGDQEEKEVPEPKPIQHHFPCLCDQRCNGKRAPVCKKDNRTWLWKSKTFRENVFRMNWE